jgi:hypothetical protein
LTETRLAADGRARHWILDAILGGGAALCAITIAHAARPDLIAAKAPATSVEHVVLTSAPASHEPPALIAFVDPVPGRVIVSPFGLRQLPWEEGGRLHAGVDISANPGEPVLAAADGVVAEAGTSSTYGRYVAIEHAEGLITFYAHMGAVEGRMAPGLTLKAGEAVGKVGSSGTSTGPHLHFEIRDQRERPLNPSLFLGKAFAEADDLPLRKARGFGRRVRVAHVSMIPKSKRALMEAKLEREAAEKALLLTEKDLKRQARLARNAGDAGKPAAATESIDGLKGLSIGEDGRPRAQLTL